MSAPAQAPVVEATPTPVASLANSPTLEGGASREGGKRRGRRRQYVKEKRRSRRGVCPCRNLKQSPRRMALGGGGMYGSPRRSYGMYGGASPSLSGGKKKRRFVRESRKSRLEQHPRCTCRDLRRSPRRSYRK